MYFTHEASGPKILLWVCWAFLKLLLQSLGFCGGSDGHETTCNARDPGSIPGSGKSPGKWNGNPLQYSCLENSMDRGAWWATVHGVCRVGHDWATNTLSISLIVIHLFGFFISSWFSTGRLHVSRDLSISSRLPSLFIVIFYEGFPDSSVGKETSCNAGDPGSIPELGRSPGEGIGYPLKYSCPLIIFSKKLMTSVFSKTLHAL